MERKELLKEPTLNWTTRGRIRKTAGLHYPSEHCQSWVASQIRCAQIHSKNKSTNPPLNWQAWQDDLWGSLIPTWDVDAGADFCFPGKCPHLPIPFGCGWTSLTQEISGSGFPRENPQIKELGLVTMKISQFRWIIKIYNGILVFIEKRKKHMFSKHHLEYHISTFPKQESLELVGTWPFLEPKVTGCNHPFLPKTPTWSVLVKAPCRTRRKRQRRSHVCLNQWDGSQIATGSLTNTWSVWELSKTSILLILIPNDIL